MTANAKLIKRIRKDALRHAMNVKSARFLADKAREAANLPPEEYQLTADDRVYLRLTAKF